MATLSQDELLEWYAAYREADSVGIEETQVVQTVNNDELDQTHIEAQIESQEHSLTFTGRFCEDCQHLLDHWPILDDRDDASVVVRQFTTIGLEAAGRHGCRFCALLLTRLKTTGSLPLVRKLETRLKRVDHGPACSLVVSSYFGRIKLYISVPSRPTDSTGEAIACWTKVVTSEVRIWQQGLTGLELAKTWLTQCMDSHEHCNRSHSRNPSWPSRLIEIRGDKVKLVPTKNLGSLPPYATLSYCWGRREFTKLGRDNMHSFLDNVAVTELPQLFREAINITKNLELRYIWIDALCIIQDKDDTTDWAYEAGLMCSVYGGATLNLAATSATDVHGSIFTKAGNHVTGFCARVTAVDKDGVAQYSTQRQFFDYEAYPESVTNTYLASRGWTLQERLLPCRTVFLGNKGLFWECQSLIASESLPDGGPGTEKIDYEAGPNEQMWSWLSIATIYSGTNLTYGEDRLPALAGIARRQHEVTGDVYLAGLWRRHLSTQLLWRRWYGSPRLPRPVWRAPSWSWMAIDSHVWFPIRQDDDDPAHEVRMIDVLEATTEPSGPAIFGSLRSGSITLSCAALVSGYVEWQVGSHEPDLVHIELGSQAGDAITALMDCTLERSAPNIAHVYLLPVLGPRGILPLSSNGNAHNAKRCLPDCRGVDPSDAENLIGLVLQRHGDTNGVFRRVGSFDLWDQLRMEHDAWPSRRVPQKTEGQYFHILKSTLEEVGMATAQKVCARTVEAGPDVLLDVKYVITLV